MSCHADRPHPPSSLCFVQLMCHPCLELCNLPLQLLHHCLVAGHVVVYRQHIVDHRHTPGGGGGGGEALLSDKLDITQMCVCMHQSVCLSVCLYLSLDLFGPVCILEGVVGVLVAQTRQTEGRRVGHHNQSVVMPTTWWTHLTLAIITV